MLICYLVHMWDAARRWFKIPSVGRNPSGRSSHAMGSEGTRIFMLGGYSPSAQAAEISLIHIFDTSMSSCSVISS